MGLFAKKTPPHPPAPPAASAAKASPGPGKAGAYFGPNITVKGTISGEDPVEIHGVVDGEIILKSHLQIGRNATIEGNLTADTITISGKAKGQVTAGSSLHLDRSASIAGSVTTPSISVHEGALFNGEMKMGTQGGGEP